MPPLEPAAAEPDTPTPAGGNEDATPAARPTPAAPTRGLALAMALLCLVGVGVSIELTRIHVFVHTDPAYHSICAMSEGVNCETVAVSR